MKYVLGIMLSLLVGCQAFPKVGGISGTLTNAVTQQDTTQGLILSLLGGVCCLGGMVLLVISKGSLGWRPLLGGIGFIVINYALALYAHWFFIPVAIATGISSLAWATKIAWNLWKNKEICLWKR